MKRLPASVILALVLTHCAARLPAPGEPVRTDIDQRWERQREAQDFNSPERTQEQQIAFEEGYAAGLRDARHRKPADPDSHDAHHDFSLRQHFLDGYEAGWMK